MSQAYKCDLCGKFYTEEDFGADCNTTWKVNFIKEILNSTKDTLMLLTQRISLKQN